MYFFSFCLQALVFNKRLVVMSMVFSIPSTNVTKEICCRQFSKLSSKDELSSSQTVQVSHVNILDSNALDSDGWYCSNIKDLVRKFERSQTDPFWMNLIKVQIFLFFLLFQFGTGVDYFLFSF